MGSPDWSKIPFEKMPEWKRQEILARNKQVIAELEKTQPKPEITTRGIQVEPPVEFKCDICGKICKSNAGLKKHLTSHK